MQSQADTAPRQGQPGEPRQEGTLQGSFWDLPLTKPPDLLGNLERENWGHPRTPGAFCTRTGCATRQSRSVDLRIQS